MKWPWNRPPPGLPPPEPATPQTYLDLDHRVQELERSVAHLTTDGSVIRMEWAEVLDKINRWFSRQAGRIGRDVRTALERAERAHEDALGDTNGEGGATRPGPLTKADLRAIAAKRFGSGR